MAQSKDAFGKDKSFERPKPTKPALQTKVPETPVPTYRPPSMGGSVYRPTISTTGGYPGKTASGYSSRTTGGYIGRSGSGTGGSPTSGVVAPRPRIPVSGGQALGSIRLVGGHIHRPTTPLWPPVRPPRRSLVGAIGPANGRMQLAANRRGSTSQASMRTADTRREDDWTQTAAQQAQIESFKQWMGTRQWSGGTGRPTAGKPPIGIDGENETIYKLLYRLPADFPVENWDKMTAKQQLAIIQRTGLSPQEQWKILNTTDAVGTLGRIQNLQIHQEAYGLTASELNLASKALLEIAEARHKAKGADSPFRDPKWRNRFLRMLDEKEAELMDAFQPDGKEALTGNEKVGYDETEDGDSGEERYARTAFKRSMDGGDILTPDAESDYQFSHSMEDFNAPDVMKRTNCYAYACDLTQDPFTGQPFFTDAEAKKMGWATGDLNYAWGVQPGSISGQYKGTEQDLYVRKDKTGEYRLFFQNIQSDMAAMGKEMIPYGDAAAAGYTDGYAVAIAMDPRGRYHFFRENGDGTWSQKDGSGAVAGVTMHGILCGAPVSDWFEKVSVSPEQYCNTPIANRGYSDFLGYYYIHEVPQG